MLFILLKVLLLLVLVGCGGQFQVDSFDFVREEGELKMILEFIQSNSFDHFNFFVLSIELVLVSCDLAEESAVFLGQVDILYSQFCDNC